MFDHFLQKQDESFSNSLLLLILLTFFIRVFPALLFFGSSEMEEGLRFFEGVSAGGLYGAPETARLSPPMLALFKLLFPLYKAVGLPMVFWIKFPAIMADVFITFFICLLTFQATQDQKKSLYYGLLYGLNPVSIVVTSLVGSDVSVGLAFIMAAFCLCLIFKRTLFSGIFFGTALVLQNLFVILLPALFIKVGRRWPTRFIFVAVVFLTWLLWLVPPIMAGRGSSVAGSFPNGGGNEVFFGLTVAIKALSDSQLLSSLASYYPQNYSFFFLAGMAFLYLFHQRHELFPFCSNVMLFAFVALPRLRPFHLVLLLPFLIFTSNRAVKYYSLTASAFLVAWYSVVSVESGTFCGAAFLSGLFTNADLYLEDWTHLTYFVCGDVLLPLILITCLLVSVVSKSTPLAQLKAKKIGARVFSFIAFFIGGWMLMGALFASGPAPFEATEKLAVRDVSNPFFQDIKYGDVFYFRSEVQMKSQITRATIKVSSDDFLIIYLNGKAVYSGHGVRYRYRHDVPKPGGEMAVSVDLTPYFRVGKNVLGVESVNASARSATGLAVVWEIQGGESERRSLPFYKGWKATAYPAPQDWMMPDFDDSGWMPPTIIKRSDKIRFSGAPWVGGSPETAVEFILPASPREFFFMVPNGYTPPESPFAVVRLLIFYSIFFILANYFIEATIHAPYLFFRRRV